MKIPHLAALLPWSLMWGLMATAQAQDLGTASPEPVPVPTTWRLTDETLKLPGGERMGLLGATLLFDVTEHWRLGVASYGAVRGERGGFITMGVAGEWQQPLSQDWSAQAGLLVGAGGGRGGYTLAGGGLMLRSHAGLSYTLGPWGRVGLGVSHVSFPSGVISSTQPYLMLEHAFFSLIDPGWGRAASKTTTGRAPLASKAQSFALVARSYRVADAARLDNGQPQHGRLQLLGFEWLSHLDDRWYLSLQADGATGGRSDGYMQILAGGGYRWPLSSSTALKLQAAAGPAGGGRVDTGGGVLLDVGVSLQQAITRSTAVELSVGEVGSPSHSFRARSLGLKLTHRFGLPALDGSPLWPGALAGFDPQALRVRATNQTYLKAAPHWRRSFEDLAVHNLGVQVDYLWSPHWFLTGQGLAAYRGKAGAYMTGQIGLGARQDLGGPWFAEAEALVGAAGGGGLDINGGAVAQANASVGYQLSPSLSVMATAGHLAAFKGDLRAHVLGLSLAYRFTGFSSR